MPPLRKPLGAQKGEADDDRFVRVTFTVPPEIAKILDSSWRQHENLDGSLCKNKSNYVVDLIRRNLEGKSNGPKTQTKSVRTRSAGKRSRP
jgi:hypothetical protein